MRLHISSLPQASLQTKKAFAPQGRLIVRRQQARLHISALPRASLQTKKAFAPQGLLIVRRQPCVRKRTTASCKQLRRHFSCRLFVCGEGEIRTRGRVTPTTVQQTVGFSHSPTFPFGSFLKSAAKIQLFFIPYPICLATFFFFYFLLIISNLCFLLTFFNS